MKAQVAYPSANKLGEGPLWSAKEQSLYWIDIDYPSIHRWHPESNTYQTWDLPTHIGSFAFRQGGGAVLALRNGFHHFDFDSQALTPIADPESHLPDNRFNDGKCDPRGCFWAGTMHDQEREAKGSLYRLDPDGTIHMVRAGAIVSNGLGWSPDHKTMYYADSGTQRIYAYDYNPANSAISNERVLVKDTDCYPDGMTVDSQGYLWSAKWDGWRVVRYSPDGQIDKIVEVPVQRPTSVMFGGPDLNQLFITSAWTRLKPEVKAQQPLAGHVFVVETDVQGLEETAFGG
ncbi:MAG: SMP-30/gluconolactonase/LRE family protein [Bacteroidota bacterium]